MARTAANPRTARVHHDGVTLAYDDLGPAGGPAVVLLHGGTGSRLSWRHLAPRLAGRYRVLALDMRGSGESDRAAGRYTVPYHGADVAFLCEQVVGRPAALVGHSYGAVVAAYVAATRPDVTRGTVLEDPPMFILDADTWPTFALAPVFPLLQVAIRDAQATDDPVGALRDWIAATPPMGDRGTMAEQLGPEGVDVMARSWARYDPSGLDTLLEDPAAVWGGHDVDTPIQVPVMVVRADPDLGPAFYPGHVERFRRLAPQASIVVAEGCGHGIHDDQPEWFARQVEDFLAAL